MAVSPARVANVTATANGLVVRVLGSAGERVSLVFLTSTASILWRLAVVSADGQATVIVP